jgi:hypothetical protein
MMVKLSLYVVQCVDIYDVSEVTYANFNVSVKKAVNFYYINNNILS